MNTLIFYYVIAFISVIFMQLASEYKRKKQKEDISISQSNNKTICCVMFFTISLIIPFFVLAFRNINVGTDYKLYIDLYSRFLHNQTYKSDIQWIGIGYATLIKIFCFVFGKNYLYFFGFIGFFTLICFWKTIYDESEKPWLSLFLLFMFFFYCQMFNQSRQLFAIGITFYAFKFIKKRQLKNYIIAILLATSIHNSAIVMLPFYWIGTIDIPKKKNYIYVFLIIATYFSYSIIEPILLKTNYGITYLANSYWNIVNKSSIYNTIIRIIMFTVCFFISGEKKHSDKSTRILVNLCYFCILFQILTLKSYVFGRITTYFFVYFILLIPNIIKKIKITKQQALIIYFIIILVGILYFYIYFEINAEESGVAIYKFLIS